LLLWRWPQSSTFALSFVYSLWSSFCALPRDPLSILLNYPPYTHTHIPDHLFILLYFSLPHGSLLVLS
jgi:hypothetical protein